MPRSIGKAPGNGKRLPPGNPQEVMGRCLKIYSSAIRSRRGRTPIKL